MIKFTKGNKTKFMFPDSNLIPRLEKEGWKQEKKTTAKKKVVKKGK